MIHVPRRAIQNVIAVYVLGWKLIAELDFEPYLVTTIIVLPEKARKNCTYRNFLPLDPSWQAGLLSVKTSAIAAIDFNMAWRHLER